MNRFATFLLLLLVGLRPLAAQAQTTRYVSTTGIQPASGSTSWANSTTDLQGAINLSNPGDVVWVASGTYKPTTTTGPDSRTISFRMKEGVAIYGGFEGNETQLNQRRVINPATGYPSSSTLSGEIGNTSSTADNSYHVVFNNSNGLTNSAVLDGFVITGGSANGSDSFSHTVRGGGIYCKDSSPTIRNCTLQGNLASVSFGYGGGIHLEGASSYLLDNLLFLNNTGYYGGGLSSSISTTGTIRNCRFANNTSQARGGGIYIELGSLILLNTTFEGNSSASGGAIFNQRSPTLINCTFRTNTASQGGGAITNNGSNPTLINTIAWSNGGANTFFNLFGTQVIARYSLFDNGVTGVVANPTNITGVTTSPFASTASTALLPCSPAINAGNPASVTVTTGPYSETALPATDLAGNPRIVGGRIDMGAVEYQAASISPARLYVAASQTATVGDGQSWATAFPDLQSALTYPCSQSLTEIWVAAGTYKPTTTTGPNSRTISFSMLSGVAIYGGFAGTETQLGQRPAINPVTAGGRPGNPSSSTLSGEIGNPNSTTDNSYHVIYNSTGLAATAVLDGFVITGGNANIRPSPYSGGININTGGGMAIQDGNNVIIRNCLLTANAALDGGGGIYLAGGSPTLANCVLQSNTDNYAGGAMANYGGSPMLTNCVLKNNTASLYGGAIVNVGGSSTLTNCVLQSNSASQGGAMANGSSSNPVLTNTVVWNNDGANTFYNDGSTLTARYSLFDASVMGYISGPGNLTTTTSPFVSASSVALLACSPAINAGDPNSTTATVGATDLAGNPRFFGGRVDMGAVEYQAAPGSPTRLYVAASQTATVGDGQSWATAFPDLQSALTYPCSQSLTEIWVAAGTYKPTSNAADRGASFVMLPGVSILGGFPATGTPTLAERNPASFTAILSGDLLGNDGPNFSNNDDNSLHVINNDGNGLTSTAVLDGFVITGGNATNSSGGAIYNQSSSPSLVNCSLQGNNATFYGGAIYNTSSSPSLTNCILQTNTAGEGGAIYNDNNSSPSLTNCTLQSNTTTYGGGAIYNNGSSPRLINCSLQSNNAGAGAGGAIYNTGSSPSLINCSLQANSAANLGGAIYNRNNSSPGLTNCSLQANTATLSGGAFYNNNSNPSLTNCVLWNNGGGNTIVNVGTGSLTARYSLFDNGVTGVVANPTNISGVTTSPFVSETSAALNGCALAIGSADPTTTTLTVGTTDLVGNDRFTNGRLDMGAYQYQGVVSDQVRAITVQPVASSMVCAGTSVSVPVSATGLGTSFSYQWYKDNTSGVAVSLGSAQSTSVLSLPTATTADAGTYRVVVSTGCNSLTSTTFSLTVNAPPIATLSASPSATLTCTNPSLTLTAGGGTSYAFAGPAGILAGSGNQRTVSAPGTYTVLVTDANGCTATSNTAISQDVVTPTASLTTSTGSSSFCANSSLTLVAGGGVSYRFSSGATQLGGSSGNTATVSTAGTYSVVVTGANGCTATASVSVSTVAATILTSVPPTSVSVCETSPVSLSVGAGGASLRYQWYKNSSQLIGQTTPTLNILSASTADNGSYYVTVTGVCGTTSTNPITLTVRPRPAAPTLATSSVTATVSTTPLPLTPFIVATGNTLSFSGVNGLLNPPVADISVAGVQNFSVTATDEYGCVSVSTPFSLTVYVPFPPASQRVCRGSALVLSVLPTAVRYQWYRVNGTALLRLTDGAGVQRGTATASLTLLSVQTSASYVCQATLANGSVVSYGPYEAVVILCGGREAAEEPTLALSVLVAPNPLVGGWLRATVRGAGGEPLRVALYDQQGRLWRQALIERATDEQPVEWLVGDVPVGVLLLRASTDRQSQTLKVLHQ